MVKPVFAFGVVGHGERGGLRLALGVGVGVGRLDGARFVARVSASADVVGGGSRRAAGGGARSIGAVVCRRGHVDGDGRLWRWSFGSWLR